MCDKKRKTCIFQDDIEYIVKNHHQKVVWAAALDTIFKPFDNDYYNRIMDFMPYNIVNYRLELGLDEFEADINFKYYKDGNVQVVPAKAPKEKIYQVMTDEDQNAMQIDEESKDEEKNPSVVQRGDPTKKDLNRNYNFPKGIDT